LLDPRLHLCASALLRYISACVLPAGYRAALRFTATTFSCTITCCLFLCGHFPFAPHQAADMPILYSTASGAGMTRLQARWAGRSRAGGLRQNCLLPSLPAVGRWHGDASGARLASREDGRRTTPLPLPRGLLARYRTLRLAVPSALPPLVRRVETHLLLAQRSAGRALLCLLPMHAAFYAAQTPHCAVPASFAALLRTCRCFPLTLTAITILPQPVPTLSAPGAHAAHKNCRWAVR